MPRPIKNILPALLVCLLIGRQTLRAADIKFPEKTAPAFTFTVADDVKSSTDNNGNLVMRFPHGYTVLLSMVDLSPVPVAERNAKDPIEELARGAFLGSKTKDSGKREPMDIDGKKGTAFFTTMTTSSGVTHNFEMIFVRVDDLNVASVALITPANMPADDTDYVNKLIQSFKFTQRQ